MWQLSGTAAVVKSLEFQKESKKIIYQRYSWGGDPHLSEHHGELLLLQNNRHLSTISVRANQSLRPWEKVYSASGLFGLLCFCRGF